MNASLANLAFVRTGSGSVLFLRTPFDRDNYAPAICFERGYLFCCYVLLRNIELTEAGLNAIVPRIRPALLRASRDRWICGFLAALEQMEKVWQVVLNAAPSRDIETQEMLAKAMTELPFSVDAILKKTGMIGKTGFPRDMQSHVKQLLILIYWGSLWRIRKPKRMTDGTAEFGGWNDEACANQLNKLRRVMFPKWETWGWSDFTARMVRDVADSKGELERKLPEGRRN